MGLQRKISHNLGGILANLSNVVNTLLCGVWKLNDSFSIKKILLTIPFNCLQRLRELTDNNGHNFLLATPGLAFRRYE